MDDRFASKVRGMEDFKWGDPSNGGWWFWNEGDGGVDIPLRTMWLSSFTHLVKQVVLHVIIVFM